ncbi:MAG TPA: S-methyl-5-thioribose-1-phosphate isomerase [Dehalococcoidia bacterium]|nr:S-methyl-5-thioribose-1-phosphate isomerase [Dehalococcoidia bacterium]
MPSPSPLKERGTEGVRLNKYSYQPVEWLGDRIRLLDQTRLPGEEVYLDIADYRELASAIQELKVRGAPAIGVAGGYGVALGALSIESNSGNEFIQKLQAVVDTLKNARPTARNLPRAVERMERVANEAVAAGKSVEQIKAILVEEAENIHAWEVEATEKISRLGAELIQSGFTVLTHCNTGPLATTGYGTALGVIIYAHEQGKEIKVFADETRRLLQGARLTTWELQKVGIPVTLITDSMAGYFMGRGKVDCVIVGADRIAANGDTANKIGTYTLAVLAKEHGIPFYVAAPTTTIDATLVTGEDIPIEERRPDEVTGFRGVRTAPEDCEAANPSFDVTPHGYITAIITERGIIREPYEQGIGEVV